MVALGKVFGKVFLKKIRNFFAECQEWWHSAKFFLKKIQKFLCRVPGMAALGKVLV
jgi:hypothetical protein